MSHTASHAIEPLNNSPLCEYFNNEYQPNFQMIDWNFSCLFLASGLVTIERNTKALMENLAISDKKKIF